MFLLLCGSRKLSNFWCLLDFSRAVQPRSIKNSVSFTPCGFRGHASFSLFYLIPVTAGQTLPVPALVKSHYPDRLFQLIQNAEVRIWTGAKWDHNPLNSNVSPVLRPRGDAGFTDVRPARWAKGLERFLFLLFASLSLINTHSQDTVKRGQREKEVVSSWGNLYDPCDVNQMEEVDWAGSSLRMYLFSSGKLPP